MSTANTIILRTSMRQHFEYKADAALKPGHLLEINSSSEVLKQDEEGVKIPMLVALEDALQGKTVDDAYAAGDIVACHAGIPGDVLNLRLKLGESAVVGSRLISSGDGTVKVGGTLQAGMLYSNTAESAEHENTITAADFDKSYTFAANSLKAGDQIRVRGNVTVNDNNSTDTLTLLLQLGGVTIATTGAVDVADLDIGYFDALITVRTIGASGTIVAEGVQALGVPGTVTAKPFNLASSTLDTTAAAKLAINADWSVAHADNEVSLTHLSVELIRAGKDETIAFAEEVMDATSAEKFIKVRVV